MLAPPAHFIDAERGDWTDEGKAGHQREQQRQYVVADRQAIEHEADDGIDQAQEHRVAGHRAEIVEAAHQRVLQIVQADGANRGTGRLEARAEDDM